MYESEIIFYIEKNKDGKYECVLSKIYIIKKKLAHRGIRIVYFESFRNIRLAKSKLKRMQSLSNSELSKLIKKSNPEMLNLINCL